MKKEPLAEPPFFANKLLEWIGGNADIEDLVGDLKEQFQLNLNSMSAFSAKLKYWQEVFALIFSYAIKSRKQKSSFHIYSSIPSSFGIFFSYCRVALRAMVKNKIFFFINVSGLVIGMTAFLFITQYIRYERSYENFHERSTDIWRVTQERFNGSELISADCETYGLLGPTLRETMSEVIEFVRMFKVDGIHYIKIGSKRLREEQIFFADSSIFEVFSLTVLEGSPGSALHEPGQMVLTKSLAKKFTDGEESALGSIITVDNIPYVVSAVIADLPPNTHLKFEMLLSHASLRALYGQYYTDEEWVGANEYTYLLVKPRADLKEFNRKLATFSNSIAEKIRNARFIAEPIRDIHLYSKKNFEPDSNGNAITITFLTIVAVFIIIIAWINYVNLAMAHANRRAREFAIRRVVGSVRIQLIFQFFSESIILNALAGAVAFALFLIGIPFFRNLSGAPVPNAIEDPIVWIILIYLIAAGSLVPCLIIPFIASYKTSTVLRGVAQSPLKGQGFRKVMVVFQFSASVILIISLCVVYLQINLFHNYDTGMNLRHTMVLRVPDVDESDSIQQSHFRVLKDELLRESSVENVARSSFVPGIEMNEIRSAYFTIKGQAERDARNRFHYFSVDAEFVSLLNLEFVAGRGFETGSDQENLVLLNEKAIKALGFSSGNEAIGSQIVTTKWKGDPLTIIGVVKDFRIRSPKEAITPLVLMHSNVASFFSIRFESENRQDVMEDVQKAWFRVFGNTEFRYFFMKDQYNYQYAAEVRFGRLIALFSALALIIATSGLFGLSVFTIARRTKEIGIRKVMGASVYKIIQVLAWDFIKMVGIAALLGIPIAYFAVREWLSGYAARIELALWQFIVPVVMVLIVALVAVSFQIIKTAQANPTNSLRAE